MSAFLGFKSDEERVLKVCHNLHDLVYFYISSTNKIFRLLNERLGTNFPIMSVKEHFSIEENLQLLVSALKEMQATVEAKGRDVQESISNGLHAKMASPTTSLQDKIAAVKELCENYSKAPDSIMGVLIAVMLKQDNIPNTIESAIRQLSSSSALSLQVSELVMDDAHIVKVLQQNKTLCNTEDSSFLNETSQHLGVNSPLPSSSFLVFLQAICVLQGHRCTQKSLKTAADYLEEVFRVLKSSYEEFQTFVKKVEDCVPAITDKQKES